MEIVRDMCASREFETILGQVKLTGGYKGSAYHHLGPAHLSIGQEAAAVGGGMLVRHGVVSLVRAATAAAGAGPRRAGGPDRRGRGRNECDSP